MAALVKHALPQTVKFIKPKNVTVCCYATKAEKRKGIDRKAGPKIDSSAQALAAKGFLRAQKEYSPPKDVEKRLSDICDSLLGNNQNETKITDLSNRFNLFKACSKEFQHDIPNSRLHSIETVGDLKEFYKTPIDVLTPLDKMRNMELPENLHVQYEYNRYHPDTDTKFGGQTAFNRSSTLVTGLKYKDKYPGHIQNQTWPYNS